MAYPYLHPLGDRQTKLALSADEFKREYPGEGDLVEFKEGIGDAVDSVVAFSNSGGGVLLIGVADDGRVIGGRSLASTASKLHQRLSSIRNVGAYDLHELHVDGSQVIAISVAPRIEGFSQTSNGRVLVRRGPTNIALYDTELVEFLSSRRRASYEESDSRVDLEAADLALIRELAESYGWPDDGTLPDRLREHRLLVADSSSTNLSVAGALSLLGTPDQYLGKSYIEVYRYEEGVDGHTARREFHGSVAQQVREAAAYVTSELGTESVVIGLHRYELDRLPEVVIREAVANAVAHRSYEQHRTSIRIDLYPREVRIESPGPLPDSVTVENIREAQAARNPRVIAVLRRLRLAEDSGRGIDVMQDQMLANLLDPPTFVDTGASLVVTLPVRGSITPQERAWIRDIERRGEIEPSDRLLLVHAARGELLTNARARRITGQHPLEARRSLQRLRDAGFIVQSGSRGGARYRISDSLSPPAGLRLTPGELRELVVELARAGPIANSNVRERTGLDRAEALRLLDAMVGDGSLERRGERRGAHYVIPGSGTS